MALWELYECDYYDCSSLIGPVGSPEYKENLDAMQRTEPGLQKVATFDAPDWNSACQKMHDYYGWEPYVPFDEDNK